MPSGGKGARAWNAFDAIVAALESVGVASASVVMFLIMTLVVIDVVMRYFFSAPLDGLYELATLYLIAAVFFLSLSHTLRCDHHVRVDILYRAAPPRARAAMALVGYALSLGLFACIFDRAVRRAWNEWISKGVIDGAYPWPTWIASFIVSIGVGVLLLRLVVLLGRCAMAAFRPDRAAGGDAGPRAGAELPESGR